MQQVRGHGAERDSDGAALFARSDDDERGVHAVDLGAQHVERIALQQASLGLVQR